ncbi:MAG: sensor histidine kinase [Chloroflexi bacterium]|nr:sensor histidine kinase [Chloroflexota bacterium]
MVGKIVSLFNRLSLAQRFMLASLIIVASGMLGVAWWVGQQIEAGVVDRTSATTALYVDSFIAPQMQELATSDSLTPEHIATLDKLVHQTDFAKQIVSFKIWNTQGRVLYSNNPANVGHVFPVQGGLARATRGWVAARISDLQDEENVVERQSHTRLLEVYSPVRLQGTDRVIGVAEFYQTVDALQGDIDSAQRQSWLLFGGVTVVMYLLLAVFVQRASNTIAAQQKELGRQVNRLSDLLTQNAELHERVRRAAARTAALNERFLRRISADLHDGPVQDMSLAVLQLDKVMAHAEMIQVNGSGSDQDGPDLAAVSQSLNHALQEVRAISAGMGLPQLQNLTVAETVARVVRSHERRTNTKVTLTTRDLPEQAPLSVKITLYRLVQEALTNAFQHAGGAGQHVTVGSLDGQLEVQVSDAGPGLNGIQESEWGEHLGLVGMRERVESLGGTFHIESRPGQGTRVSALVPIQVWDMTA